MTVQNDLTLSSSYYHLYKIELASAPIIKNRPLPSPSSSSIDSSSVADNTKSFAVRTTTQSPVDVVQHEKEELHSNNKWIDDTWTEKCISEAKNRLKQSRDRCRIVVGSSIKDDDDDGGSSSYDYAIEKYERDAAANWNRFYRRHKTNFFKDRHYLLKDFPEDVGRLFADSDGGGTSSISSSSNDDIHEGDKSQQEEQERRQTTTIFEIGCGVGNNVIPLLSSTAAVGNGKMGGNNGNNATSDGFSSCISPMTSASSSSITFCCYDFSPTAIDMLRQNPTFAKAERMGKATAGVWDITMPFSSVVPRRDGNIIPVTTTTADLTFLFFCLSAISPEKMPLAARNVSERISAGGVLLFRDYGRYDEAQMKLGTSRNKELGDNFYVKHDGTRCYYFSLEDLQRLFGTDGEEGCGLEVLELRYIRRLYKNRGDGTTRRRVWVQARFRKPLS